MATSKTLAPTNVTISIPAMTDQPDASVFSNCVDKEADAINALNSQISIKSYEFTDIGFNAGDIGIRAVQQSKDLTSDINTYGTPTSAVITSISDSGKCHFQAFFYGASLYLNGYSATTNSMSNNSVTVRVTFKKS